MDEVDGDEFDELEARLYGQVHHEALDAVDSLMGELCPQRTRHAEAEAAPHVETVQRVVTHTSVINNGSAPVKGKRYWSDNFGIRIDKAKDVTTNGNKEVPAAKMIEAPTDSAKSTKKENATNINNNKNNGPKRQNLNRPIESNPAQKKKPNQDALQYKQNTKAVEKQVRNPVVQALSRYGPFARQAQKLDRVKQYTVKKKRAKQAVGRRITSAPIVTISLDGNDSENDDVELVPNPPAPIVTIDDSDDEIAASDFVRPQSIIGVGKTTADVSRCNSPGSILSADDFISENDQQRLLGVYANIEPDNEDLRFITANLDNMLEAPAATIENESDVAALSNVLDANSVSSDVPVTQSTSSATIGKTNQIDLSEDHAMDGFGAESEVDASSCGTITPKPSIINAIADSNSDEEEVMKTVTRNIQKKVPPIVDQPETTAVSYISRGPAVDTVRLKKRCNSISSRRASVGGGSVGHMSDSEFLEIINNLAQGGDVDESDADSEDNNNTVTARDIAEQVLHQKDADRIEDTAREGESDELVANVTEAESMTENQDREADDVNRRPDEIPIAADEAIPQAAIADLGGVFELINNLGKRKQRVPSEEAIVVSDNSNDEVVNMPTTQITEQTEKSGPMYNIVYINEANRRGGVGWNDEMRKFYNCSWGGERFSVRAMTQTMNPQKNHWKIYSEDRFPEGKRCNGNLKCYNCCEYGHIRSKCKRPRKPLICYMCGEQGHYEPRCPNTVCLRCGNKTHIFTKTCNACTFQNRLICPICKVRGHTITHCPDKWRRYHSTTTPNSYPNSQIVYTKKKHCCICGGIGHVSENCTQAVRAMEYPLIVSGIKSHQKSYTDISIQSTSSGIPVNLLYDTYEDYAFNLAERATPHGYYTRFLKAVGMDFLLNRKRKKDTSSRTTAKQPKLGSAKKSASTPAPNQVPEVTESGNIDNDDQAEVVAVATDTENNERNQVDQSEMLDEVSNEEINFEVEPSPQQDGMPNCPKSPTEVKQQNILRADDDSNYSFSEHFNTNNSLISNTAAETMATEMPDFIPICSDEHANSNVSKTANNYIIADSGDNVSSDAENVCGSNTADYDSDDAITDLNAMPDFPCEAKIFLTEFHSKYLLSPNGAAFLKAKSIEHDIKGRLDLTSVGYVLVVFGLKSNQNSFHADLLQKYRQISDVMKHKRQMNSHHNVPKRVDVLIRFLRESINQLLTNLGNINIIFSRVKNYEKQNSKSGLKAAEKGRRLLNMILVGQAGLNEGSKHLDKLLLNLKSLLKEYDSSATVPNNLRDEIAEHYRHIFTAYRHDNYPELMECYHKMVSKNRIHRLNIDPALLGCNIINALQTEENTNDEGDAEMQEPSSANTLKIVPNPLHPKHAKNLKHTRKRILDGIESTTPALVPAVQATTDTAAPNISSKPSTASTLTKSTWHLNMTNGNSMAKDSTQTLKKMEPTMMTTTMAPILANASSTYKGLRAMGGKKMHHPPFGSAPRPKWIPQTKLNKTTMASANDKILRQNSAHLKEHQADLTKPSAFWSEQSLKYLNDCIKIARNSRTDLIGKLHRIRKKSLEEALSYNDYRTVIKLHSVIIPQLNP